MKILPDSKIVFLTGAGISVASGIRPFRGAGGLWSEVDPMTHSSAKALQEDFEKIFYWHYDRAQEILDKQPNAAHFAISSFEKKHNASVAVLTQNIDFLHQRAGSSHVVEVHGSLRDIRCSEESCGTKLAAPKERPTSIPLCPRCNRWMRYDVTLFDEPMPLDPLWEARKLLRNCDIFIAVGTSGVVSPAAEFVREAHYAGAFTALVNAEAHEKPNSYFLETIIGKAEEVLPNLLGVS